MCVVLLARRVVTVGVVGVFAACRSAPAEIAPLPSVSVDAPRAQPPQAPSVAPPSLHFRPIVRGDDQLGVSITENGRVFVHAAQRVAEVEGNQPNEAGFGAGLEHPQLLVEGIVGEFPRNAHLWAHIADPAPTPVIFRWQGDRWAEVARFGHGEAFVALHLLEGRLLAEVTAWYSRDELRELRLIGEGVGPHLPPSIDPERCITDVWQLHVSASPTGDLFGVANNCSEPWVGVPPPNPRPTESTRVALPEGIEPRAVAVVHNAEVYVVGGRLARWDGKSWTFIDAPPDLSWVGAARDGTLWVRSGNVLFEKNGALWNSLDLPAAPCETTGIYPAGEGDVWVRCTRSAEVDPDNTYVLRSTRQPLAKQVVVPSLRTR
jgi:hypothetical protein